MSGGSGQLATGSVGHLVQFYGDDRELAASVSEYAAGGIEAGDSVVILATGPHRRAFEAEMTAAGIDAGTAVASGGLLMLDAGEMLREFLDGDRLDHDRFEAVAGRLIRQAASPGRPVRIYAEMVALLWDAGQVTLALELEELWNMLGSRSAFTLLCGYRVPVETGQGSGGDVAALRRLHTGVIALQPGQPAREKTPGTPAREKTPATKAEVMRSFPQTLQAARAARYFVVGLLGSRRDQALTQDAAIVTAELAANAVSHARSGFTVSVSQSAGGVRISVRDGSRLPPGDGDGSLAATPGHGLGVVSAIATRWAVEPVRDGKVVWAELPASPPQEG